ncbi:MAG: helix-turn-helix transcriptional regulator [Thermoflexaceae bacterium]|nr:helix-turn-helix transcriptional regulator [Thermoflexaceae bacterium]
MFYEKIIEYCTKNNLSIRSFEKKCNIGNGTISRWADGKSRPSLRTLEKISNATGISVFELMQTKNQD